MKRPTEEEFKRAFDEIKENHGTKMKALAERYGVSLQSIYIWENFYYKQEPLPLASKSWDEWVSELTESNDKVNPYEEKFFADEDSLFVCMSDTHFGSKGIINTIKALDDDINSILKHENIYILMLGDIIDYGPDSPKGLVHDQLVSYKDELDVAQKFMEKIGERVVCVTSGCHSHFTYNLTGIFPEEALAKQTLTGIFLQDSGFLTLHIKDQKYRVYLTHKSRGWSRKNPSLGLMNLAMESDDFDIAVSAHRHIPSVSVVPLHRKMIHLINCGSYQGLNAFARKGGYGPIFNSTPAFFVSSKRKQILSFIDFHDALDYLRW